MTATMRHSASMIFAYYLVASTGWSYYSCPNQDTGWEKISGAKPVNGVESPLYRNGAIGNNGIVVPCFDRCKSANCTAFVIDFARNICYSVQVTSAELIPESNATFFHQVCLKVQPSCKQRRLWQVERTLGAILKDEHTSLQYPTFIRRTQCYERCLEAGDQCGSAQFRTSLPLSIDDAIGLCLVSRLERGTRPQAYRSSMYRDEYLQDQCHNISRKSYCSYAEFQNVTLPYSDVALPGLSAKQCEERCDQSVDGFICKAYTIDHSEEKPLCLLHSDDTIALGISSLIAMPNVTYKEREACLDLKVQCGESLMTVTLITTEPFEGRMYVIGHSELCGVQGVGRNVTTLNLPLPKKESIDKPEFIACGLTPAFSIDSQNRTHTLVWTIIVIQYNPIIQRQGDQSVKVGCSLDGNGLPEPKNVSVHSSFSFSDPNAGVPPVGSIVVNTSSEVPVVTMRILNEENQDAVVTQLGERLTLKIEIHPANGPYDIMAEHLVASSASGESSYLLLDQSGCPTDPTTFPALLKDPTDNRSLIATFTAFKFPDSQIVRFNVIIRFCYEECQPTTCRGGQISYGKRRRRSVKQSLSNETAEIYRNLTPTELPLQLSIVVQSPVITADHLMSRENPDTFLLAGERSIDGLFCVDASLALGLLIFWLIIQIVLTIGCLLTVRRYRRMAVEAEEDRADILARHLYGIHGGNFEIARRVRWADRNGSSTR